MDSRKRKSALSFLSAAGLGLLVSLVGVACASVQAPQGDTPSAGTTEAEANGSSSPSADVSPAEVEPAEASTVLAGVYTLRQASRGEDMFRRVCAVCHESAEFGGRRFRSRWRNLTVGAIYDFVFENMPQGNPGSLSTDEYVDILAYFLSMNEYPVGANELPADPSALRSIRVEDPR